MNDGGAAALIGRTIAGGKYQIIRMLGEGGMGAVYQARQTAMDRMVALKLIRPEMGMSRNAVTRFYNEMMATAKVDHPNTIRVYDFGESDGQLFLAMEFVAGRSLGQAIDDAGRMDLRRVVRIGKQVGNALGAIHERGIVHRDLKPDNVMLIDSHGEADFVKVLDFGIAKSLDDDSNLTGTGRPIGTPAYMAPEQAMGMEVDLRADLYALGVMLYRMASGQVPFNAPTAGSMLIAHATQPATPVAAIAPDIAPPLAALIMQLLEKEPAKRPNNAAEVVARLEACVQPGSSASMSLPSQTPVSGLPRATAASIGHAGTMVSGDGPTMAPAAARAHVSGYEATGAQIAPVTAPAAPAAMAHGAQPYGTHMAGYAPMAHGEPAGYPAPVPPQPQEQATVPQRGLATRADPEPKKKRGVVIALVAGGLATAGVIAAVVGGGGGGGESRNAVAREGSGQPAASAGSAGSATAVPAAVTAPAVADRKELDELLGKTEPLAPESCRGSEPALVGKLTEAARAIGGDGGSERVVAILGDDPGPSGEAWTLLARAWMPRDAAKAEVAAKRAVELCPSYAVALNVSGNVQQKLGNAQAAEDAYVRALTAAPMYDAPRFNLGLLQARQKDATAIATFTELLRRRPDHPNVHLARAQAYVMLGRNAEALPDLEEAVKRQPDNPDAWAALGELRERLRKGDARAAYCRAKELGHPTAAKRCRK